MGFTILGIGYLLVFPGSRLIDLPYVSNDAWEEALKANILHLIGATLIVFVLIMHSTTTMRQMQIRAIVAAVAVLCLSPIMHMEVVHSNLPMWLRPYLTIEYKSIFPFFPLAAYFFFGSFLGTILKPMEQSKRDRLMYVLGAIGVVVAVPLFTYQHQVMNDSNWKTWSSPNSEFLVFARSSAALAALALCTLSVQYTTKLNAAYQIFGRKGLHIYVIHIVLLYGTPWWDGYARYNYRSLSTYGIYRYEKLDLQAITRARVRKAMLGILALALLVGW
jgi:uncharacterized membrane protein